MTEPRCTGVKVCASCEEELSVLAFAVNKTMADGVRSDCRDCSVRKEMLRLGRRRGPSTNPLADYLSARRYD